MFRYRFKNAWQMYLVAIASDEKGLLIEQAQLLKHFATIHITQ